jgi:hypothetical protein
MGGIMHVTGEPDGPPTSGVGEIEPGKLPAQGVF